VNVVVLRAKCLVQGVVAQPGIGGAEFGELYGEIASRRLALFQPRGKLALYFAQRISIAVEHAPTRHTKAVRVGIGGNQRLETFARPQCAPTAGGR